MTASLKTSPPVGITATPTRTFNRWILGCWTDQLLIVFSPLLIVPIVLVLNSPWVGVQAETIAMVVTAFFALGHHLPGMIRAYGDRDLFQRFRARFIIVPTAMALISGPMYRYHFEVYMLLLFFWGCWHGLMQLYGFARIYDAKAGSTSPTTIMLDWLLCLCWFPTALLYSDRRTADFLGFWYSFNAPAITLATLTAVRTISLTLSVLVLVAFLVNLIRESVLGRAANPMKLWMLLSGIGFWWFSFVYLQFSALSVTLFEIAHDVQYIAIAWQFNCRRVSANSEFHRLMKYLFRRGMVLLYLGLVVGYGAIGLVPSLVKDRTLFDILNCFILNSTILHYYYDGFIWKVREQSIKAGLGIEEREKSSAAGLLQHGGLRHFLKWSPLLVFIAWLFLTDWLDARMSPQAIDQLERRYTKQISDSNQLPTDPLEQSWLYNEFTRAQRIAEATPNDEKSQMTAAVLLTNFGRNDEAIRLLDEFLKRRPTSYQSRQLLGEIELHVGNVLRASTCFSQALSLATTPKERAAANLKLGETALLLKDFELAKISFDNAIKDDPEMENTVNFLREKNRRSGPPP